MFHGWQVLLNSLESRMFSKAASLSLHRIRVRPRARLVTMAIVLHPILTVATCCIAMPPVSLPSLQVESIRHNHGSLQSNGGIVVDLAGVLTVSSFNGSRSPRQDGEAPRRRVRSGQA